MKLNLTIFKTFLYFPKLDIKFLPPSSPILNPIENCFSPLKANLKHCLSDIAGTLTIAAARAAGQTLRTHREQALHRALEHCIPTIRAEMVAAMLTLTPTFTS